MKYGFIIDNRKCIGCHACTTACKSEHDVPVGVNRTWVKQVEKGEFPNSRRLFSVMRCNHCTDAPCVEICPVEALYVREDGIVDFDKRRCIGCKSCMQACPYDALYIDPETHTAAKCNYCAHRIDIGLEPACVNVCPEHAIISGDMDDPHSEIAMLLSRQQVSTRKPEKATRPNLYYIDADDVSLIASNTEKSDAYFWSSQSLGVGHFAKEAEKLAFSNTDVVDALMKMNGPGDTHKPKTVEVLMDKAKRIYDAPDKGILWGWEVSGYVWTKAISAGTFLVLFLLWFFNKPGNAMMDYTALGVSLVFLALTGLLLVLDLDQPKRFHYVILRPQWNSWLVKGGYAITVFGGLLTLLIAARFFDWQGVYSGAMWATGTVAVVVAIYTAFLFAQAKGRDFWQSPTLAIHMLVHSIMAGAAVLLLLNFLLGAFEEWESFLGLVLVISILVNAVTILFEMVTTHPTQDAKTVVYSITRGRYRNLFWVGIVLVGNILPLILLTVPVMSPVIMVLTAILVLIGIYITEHVWVEAPQRVALS